MFRWLRAPPFEDVLYAAPTLEAQLLAALFHALLSFFWVMYVCPSVWRPILANMRSREHYLAQNKRLLAKVFMIELNDTPSDKRALFEYALLIPGVLVQHAVGGFLCLPACLGGLGLPKEVVTAMVCHGGLSEVGLELQDALYRIKQILFDGDIGKSESQPLF